MNGLMSSRRGAALYLLVWLLTGMSLAGLIVASTNAAWTNALVFAVPVTEIFAFGAGFSAFYLCRAYPLGERSAWQIIGVFVLAAIVAASIWGGICLAWNALLQSFGVEWAGLEWTPFLRGLVFGLGMALYGLTGLAHYLVREFERARQAERREFESRLMAQDAELRMLRTQIDPHFLFNSLNSISALTAFDAARAREMTLQLSDFFRMSLRLDAHKKVSIDTEMRLIGHFLAIEQVRFGSRLQVQNEVEEAALACLVPPMILQPLVENAVKHGIGQMTAGGCIRIRIARQGSLLRMAVENEIDPDGASAAPGNGIGLANVRQRLQTEYGTEASVFWGAQDQVFRVELTVPVLEGEDAHAGNHR
ncbi:sensor histidine kinase [Massilia sp. TS11]|uniref:sensor histidine kinase n=1 Tax=Massilia sp. TS11 TaxID=2908003 RepID=UPI001EDB6A0F|nr:histidine kinase [Massilia sp. TS11]MCG2584213.1 histidine kinase [Massilia sp. TS11]